ncbi:MAG: glycosyltransferase [Bacillota bacterium]|nr:glycosyltransferase [Bacillota bacterium]
MSKVLFLNLPAYGHVNPTLGLAAALVKMGEEVVYFCSEEFRDKIEKTGAEFRCFKTNYEIGSKGGSGNKKNFKEIINKMLARFEETIEDVLSQTKGIKFDYIVHGSVFPCGNTIGKILNIPTISSFAIFATPEDLISMSKEPITEESINQLNQLESYQEIASSLKENYNLEMPKIIDLFFSRGDLNIAYTSKYFISHNEYYDDSFKFIGPPIYNRKENLDFPFNKLEGKKVIYISLGTVYNNSDTRLYDVFFKAFGDEDVVVVMTAYNLDTSKFHIPNNFIVRNYVPQTEILKYTHAAVIHGGMNTTSDMLYNNIPFVTIPIGADQPYMAARSAELGASINLDKDTVSPEILRDSIEKVIKDPSYIENIKKIGNSFKESGGYARAAEEISLFKEKRDIK